MSGVVTPPPRPPRPYLPAQQSKSRKDGTKLTPNKDGGSNGRPSSGRSADTSSNPEILRRSYTYSSGNDLPPRPQRPNRQRSTGSQSSSGRETSSPERQMSPGPSKAVVQEVQKRARVGSPIEKSMSIATPDDSELRRWSYGFESGSTSKSPYRPRAPPPPPTIGQLSSESIRKSTESEAVSEQDLQEELRIQRRSYTFGSSRSLPSYPVHRSRQRNTSSRSSSEREVSTSPERQVSQDPFSSVEISNMETLVEKTHSADSKKSAPSRPSRPPPPRTKSLPKVASFTTYKNQRDRVSEPGRPHSKSTAESHTVTRPHSSQGDLLTSSAKQPSAELHMSEQEQPLVNITDVSGQPDVTATASNEAPVIPPRPVRPPRPFPPGKSTKRSPARVKGANGHTQKSNTKSRGKIPRSGKQEPNTSDTALMQSVELSSELVANGTTSISQVVDKEPAILGDLEVSNNQVVSQSAQNTEESHSESVVAQGQLDIPNVEEPAIIQAQPSTPVSGTGSTNQPETTNTELSTQTTEFSEEEIEDQVSPLPASNSPRSKGSRFISSMKKSFHSLRSPRRKHTQTSGRHFSEPNISVHGQVGQYPDPLPQGIIHPIVVQCVAYLNKESVLREEGLFRVPGDVAAIKQLRERFIAGSDVDLTEVVDPHTVAGLLKLHFREQRVSMIPRGQPLTSIIEAVKDKDVGSVRDVINSIDVSLTAMLRIVAELLTMVVSFSEDNKMSSGTLATSCAPSMFPYLPTSSAVLVMKFLIDHSAEIFQQ